MIVMWSLLVFVGYNVLTVNVEAAESDDKQVCEDYGGEWKKYDTGDNSRGCHIENEKDRQLYGIRPGYSLSGTSADAEYGRLDIDVSDEEAAAQEDVICDDEDAGTTNVKGCMSEDRKNNQQKNEREWYYNENTNQYEYLSDEEIKEHNMETESEIMQGEKWGPETPIEPPSEPYPTTEEPVIEDHRNTVTTEDEEALKEIVKNVKDSEGQEVRGGVELEWTAVSDSEEDNESKSSSSEEEEEVEADEPEEEEDEPQEEEEESNDESEEEDSNENEEDNNE